MQELELAANRALTPYEPHSIRGAITPLSVNDFKRRTWATRRRPWVDRLACAWLIRRFIDRKARILWLAKPKDCPAKAVGFDFDGATFSHVGARVTFEVMVASFGLEQPALKRIGAIVHYLDAGGVHLRRQAASKACWRGCAMQSMTTINWSKPPALYSTLCWPRSKIGSKQHERADRTRIEKR